MVNPVSTGKMAAGPTENFQPAVLYKLIIFTVAMAVAPIGTYFTVLKYFVPGAYKLPRYIGSTTASAIAAIIAANLILVGYIIVAWLEGPPSVPPSGKGVGELKKDK